MKRVIGVLVLGAAAVVVVLAFNRQAGSDAVRRQMLGIVSDVPCSEADRSYLLGEVERFHVEAAGRNLSESGTQLDAPRYVSAMFDYLIESSRRDGKSEELIGVLQQMKVDTVAANRGR